MVGTGLQGRIHVAKATQMTQITQMQRPKLASSNIHVGLLRRSSGVRKRTVPTHSTVYYVAARSASISGSGLTYPSGQ